MSNIVVANRHGPCELETKSFGPKMISKIYLKEFARLESRCESSLIALPYTQIAPTALGKSEAT
jgi:hypothetical protein